MIKEPRIRFYLFTFPLITAVFSYFRFLNKLTPSISVTYSKPIFYTDIDDLKSIIAANWLDFKEIFPNFQWVVGKIEEIEMSRNIIAHNNPLEERDVTRLKLNLEDWIMQISRWREMQSVPQSEERG